MLSEQVEEQRALTLVGVPLQDSLPEPREPALVVLGWFEEDVLRQRRIALRTPEALQRAGLCEDGAAQALPRVRGALVEGCGGLPVGCRGRLAGTRVADPLHGTELELDLDLGGTALELLSEPQPALNQIIHPTLAR